MFKLAAFNGLLEKHAIMFWKCIFMEIAGKFCLLYLYNYLATYHNYMFYLEKMKITWLDLFHSLKPKLD